MKRFGWSRLFRNDISFFHKVYFIIFGVSPDHKLRYLYLNKMLKSHLVEKSINNILDAGCGSGDYSYYFAEKFPKAVITAIDIDGNRINKNIDMLRNTKIKNILFKAVSISEINDTNKYDLICCIDVLEHIENTDEAFKKLAKSMSDNGVMYIHLPLKKVKPVIFDKRLSEFHDWEDEEHIAEPYTKSKLIDMITNNGFIVVSCSDSFNHYLGEFCVSLIMLFYKDTIINNLIKTILSPVMQLLIYADVMCSRKAGNAIAVLIKKPS